MTPARRSGQAAALCRLALLFVLALVIPAPPALAHSELRRSVPATGAVLDQPPPQIELHFTERVQVTALRLHRANGGEITLPRRAIRETQRETIALPELVPGDYRAEWRIISADGHPVGGVIVFRIEAGRAP